jgi:hypothetical protein
MLELQWVRYEKRRNKALKKEWRATWNKMMVEISKVFKVPPTRLRRQTNNRSIRYHQKHHHEYHEYHTFLIFTRLPGLDRSTFLPAYLALNLLVPSQV